MGMDAILTRYALPGYSAYAAMKGAVKTLTKYLAKELGACGIAVNVVVPAAIGRQSLDQCATDRGVRRHVHLNKLLRLISRCWVQHLSAQAMSC